MESYVERWKREKDQESVKATKRRSKKVKESVSAKDQESVSDVEQETVSEEQGKDAETSTDAGGENNGDRQTTGSEG